MTDGTNPVIASVPLIVGLGQVRYILKSVANGDDQREIAPMAVEIVEAAQAALEAMPDVRELVDAGNELARVGDDKMAFRSEWLAAFKRWQEVAALAKVSGVSK